ncbi:NAD(P)-dependent alcohol dehydrogenase [Jiangella mangrovi]|uniref:NADPH:quinone reductase-like Zn-dependent oxidoreductase n=1 Tax=Jiangella mangrovi TaxID=1524084 RepID=A0A7W9GM66_9ACTN|nr:NAD(P)-dependent alcohol dehydrogenase [Jiangella mangrovi]MBB5786096.1 NADPH:quinone reductase-like Zn-dependent oxidoreductase [Jiangella mangrovi]
MKAFVIHSYGSPDVLEPADVETPVPGDDEVLVRVRATSVQPYDWHHMRGEPRIARLMPGTLGLRAPKLTILGADVAGEVAAVGRDVTGFAPGDRVFALVAGGGFAEYVSVPAAGLAPMPRTLSFERAAAVPLAGITALLAVRDDGRVQPGQRVLVNGASGGVGTFVVQLATAMGATVTGVCGGRNAELVRGIGAVDVVDHTTADVTRGGGRFDLVVDIAGGHSARAFRRILTHDGTLVVVGGPAGRWVQPAGHTLAAVALNAFVSQRMLMTDVVGSKDRQANLLTLTEYLDDGRVVPVVGRTYPFAEIPDAIRFQEDGRASGKVVVTF